MITQGCVFTHLGLCCPLLVIVIAQYKESYDLLMLLRAGTGDDQNYPRVQTYTTDSAPWKDSVRHMVQD